MIFFFFFNTGFLCISSFFVLVWSYLLGTTVHLSVSCSLVQRGRRAQTLGALSWSCWGCFSSALFLFFLVFWPIALLTWHTCASPCQYGLPHFAPWLSSHLRVFEVSSQKKKYQNECNVTMVPDLFLFTSVHVSQKPAAGGKKNVDVRWFVSVELVTIWRA